MKITVIPPKARTKLVCAYARVSTLSEEQEESYETQVNYYTDYIKSRPGWVLVDIFADRGFSGTTARKRKGFARLVEAVKGGRVNLVITKSISRFARNTREAVGYVQLFKSKGVEVIFEKEGISTFDESRDMIFNILAAMAQEESKSISQNTRWSLEKLAKQGVRRLGSNRVFGYDEIDGELVPNKDAAYVEMIFRDYARGKRLRQIIAHLEDAGAVPLRGGKRFSHSTILTILQNEIYTGNRIIQKTPPQNYLTKQPETHTAYTTRYISNAHPAIISPALWHQTQTRLTTRPKRRR